MGQPRFYSGRDEGGGTLNASGGSKTSTLAHLLARGPHRPEGRTRPGGTAMNRLAEHSSTFPPPRANAGKKGRRSDFRPPPRRVAQ